jgi:hypothetical protein
MRAKVGLDFIVIRRSSGPLSGVSVQTAHWLTQPTSRLDSVSLTPSFVRSFETYLDRIIRPHQDAEGEWGNDHTRIYLHSEISSHKASDKGTGSNSYRDAASAFETRLRPLLWLHRLSARSAALTPNPINP